LSVKCKNYYHVNLKKVHRKTKGKELDKIISMSRNRSILRKLEGKPKRIDG
jgi:hypothetical protein